MRRSRSRSRHRRRPARRPLWRKFADLLLAIALIGAVALIAARLERDNATILEGRAVVHDGDTISLQGERIRLSGMDAPEMDQSCMRGETSYRCGREARAALVSRIDGKPVRCIGEGRDRYDRLLAICMSGGIELNRHMVSGGWAVATDDYWREQREARAARQGIWSGSFEEPRAWRQRVLGEMSAFPFWEWLGSKTGLW